MSGRAAVKIGVEETADAAPSAAPLSVPAVKASQRRPAAGRQSPLDLQREVADAVAAGAFEPGGLAVRPDRWSARRTLGFIFVTCSAFWICVGLLVTELRQ
jgi:hypothetical protein